MSKFKIERFYTHQMQTCSSNVQHIQKYKLPRKKKTKKLIKYSKQWVIQMNSTIMGSNIT